MRDTVPPLLSPLDMSAVDRAAAQSGIAVSALMRRAGLAVCAAALRHFAGASRFVVLSGPGNNGGDGWIAAAGLRDAGAEVAVFHLADPDRLTGAVAEAFRAAAMTSRPLTDYAPLPGDVVVDAVFGAGLSRAVPEVLRAVIARVDAAGVPVLAVDLPSGIDGRTGAVLGASFQAARTVTFAARKFGHVLLPGRSACGVVEIADIGIPARILSANASAVCENGPPVWADALPPAASSDHKYRRGHVAVLSGGACTTGAARLSAMASLKAGAGLVTLAGDAGALAVHAAHVTAIMLREIAGAQDLAGWIGDRRINTFVLGPGFGDGGRLRSYAAALSDRHLVLDADGFTAFAGDPAALFSAFAEGPVRLVMTPHDGEFRRLFPDIADDPSASKIDKAIAAARRSHGVVVLKGADTVIAAPDGRAVVNGNAPPFLATAGSGDVLAGIIAAHMANGLPAFEAAAAGVWRHGAAGSAAGEGLTADSLVDHIPPLR
ncbi:NAD(P)H-hydrate dehydratase [Ensifer soli]|uniref:NAD(P)H-hydrate dehydratase n=1 Tax=Ciceribacter sp. sgz301302 TaxID=3342379 RepID=UPI0035B8FFCD